MGIGERLRTEETAEGVDMVPTSGDPDGVILAAEGTLAWDETADLMYANTDGATAWKLVIVGGGPLVLAVRTEVAAYVSVPSDHVILCDATAGAFTVTLPAAATNTGLIYHIKKIDASANGVTVDGNAAETIDGALTPLLALQYDSIMVICDGSNWHIL